jgi:hypothetical protein
MKYLKKLKILKEPKYLPAALLALFIGICCPGCAPGPAPETETVTPADVSAIVSSEEEIVHIGADEAVRVLLDGEEHGEIFLLASRWYGEEFESEDSLNKRMMMSYSAEGSHAPYALNGCEVALVFDSAEGTPSSVRLTQIANTVRSNTGMSYKTEEIVLSDREDGGYSFELNFRDYRMYYFELECGWENGNTARYVFALEKGKKK